MLSKQNATVRWRVSRAKKVQWIRETSIIERILDAFRLCNNRPLRRFGKVIDRIFGKWIDKPLREIMEKNSFLFSLSDSFRYLSIYCAKKK